MTVRSGIASAAVLTVALACIVAGQSPVSAATPTAPITLGAARDAAVLAATAITSTGPSTISGQVGVSPGHAITGFPPAVVTDGSLHPGDAAAAAAHADLIAAYADADSRSPTTAVPAELAGLTLTPGVYGGGALALTGTITLDAQGDPGAIFLIRAGSTLTSAAGSGVTLTNGADACNVFWQIGTSATLAANTTFAGTLMAAVSITSGAATTVEGRLLARDGAITMDSNAIRATDCSLPQSTLTLTTSATSVDYGTPVTLTATIAPLAATGTVTFTVVPVSGPRAGMTTVLGSVPAVEGVASLTVPLPAFGLNTVTAYYGGDATHGAAWSNQVTVEVTGYAGELIVTEFRTSGPGGAGDSYLELYNTGARVPLGGFVITSDSGAVTTLPANAGTLGNRRTFLLVAGAFSLTGVASPDQGMASPGSGGVQVQAPDTAGSQTDAVGPASGFHRGTGLPGMIGTPGAQYAWVRAQLAGRPRDSGNNSRDFNLVSTSGAVIGGVQSMLGSPSPTGRTDPFQHNSELPSSLLDPAASASAVPNQVYVPGTPGQLVIRRTLTNTSTETITVAELRITSLSEANGATKPGVILPPPNQSNLRVVDGDTATSSVPVSGGGTVTVYNLDVDLPVTGLPGGGMNSTLSVPLPGGGLLPGQSRSVSITFAVDTGGRFWFGYDVDAILLPGPPGAARTEITAAQLSAAGGSGLLS